jgi:hypothetical protein
LNSSLRGAVVVVERIVVVVDVEVDDVVVVDVEIATVVVVEVELVVVDGWASVEVVDEATGV